MSTNPVIQKPTRKKLVAEVAAIKGDNGSVIMAEGMAYKWQDGATGIPGLPNLVPAQPISHAVQFGASFTANTGGGTYSGDYSSEIQAAHDYMASIGGGELLFSQGVIPISNTVYLGEGQGVTLRGLGRGSIGGGNKSDFLETGVTRFHWTGSSGGTMLELTSDRNNSGNNPRYGGGGIVDCMIDGNETADYGLRIWSHAGHTLRVLTGYCTAVHVTSGVLSNGVKSGHVADVQRFKWDIHCAEPNTSTQADAMVWFTGDSTVGANTSLGKIEDLHLRPETSAVSAHFESVDSVVVDALQAGCRGTATGDGGKVFLHAANTLPVAIGTASARHARSNHFGFVQAKNGFIAKADTIGTFHSEANVISMFSTENGGGSTPTVEASASLWWTNDLGNSNITSV